MKQRLAIVLFIPALCSLKINSAKAQVNIQDSLALVDLYNSTNGPKWLNHANWLTSTPVSKWHGVNVLGNRVSELSLTQNKLTGNIPVSFGNLTNLEQFFLDGNKLSGNIPSSFGNLIHLNTAYLGANQLTGKIPSSIGKLANLQILDLGENMLTGIIPYSFSKLSMLTDFSAGHNQLSGNIYMLAKLDSLQGLYLTHNQLSGHIPVFSSIILSQLDLSVNQFSGNIPQFKNCALLNDIELEYNFLTGTIQHQFDSLSNPDLHIYIDHNQLSGSLPSFNKFTHLIALGLSFNNFSGSIPALDSLKNIIALYLSNNKLSGSIPSSLNAVHKLTEIDLSSNQLSDGIPDVDSLTNLSDINFSHNQLSGSIPASISSLYNLAAINFADNHLSCTVPLIRLNNFFPNSLYLDSNKFTFAGMEKIATDYSFAVYAPQAKIYINQLGNMLSVSAGGTLSNNTYKWYRNGTLFKTKTGDSILHINTNGNYSVSVTNAVATALTLQSNTVHYAADMNIVALQFKEENNFSSISVYPNPAKTNATISFYADGKYKIIVSDISGKALQTKNGISSKNINIIQLDVSNYEAGVYFISIYNEQGQKRVLKLNKQ